MRKSTRPTIAPSRRAIVVRSEVGEKRARTVDPAPLLHRPTSRNVGVALAATVLAAAASLLLAHHTLLASGLRSVPGDPGDVRFVHYCIEHTWAWLTGHPLHRRFWDLPFFFPAPDTGAYSDVLLGVAPPYWLFRALGAGPESAYAGWLLVSTALNAAAATWLLRGALGVRWLAAATGGVLVAAGAPRMHLMNHPQLICTYWLLAAVGLLVVALRAPGTWRARAAWLLAGCAAAAEAWSSYYLWWFLGLALAIALGLGLLLKATRPGLLEALRRDWAAIAVAAGLSLLMVLPLLRGWWSVAHAVGLRDARDVFLARGQSWLNIGPDSWWYGALVRSLTGLRYQTNEQQYGVGLLTLAAVALGFWRARHRGGVVVLGLTAVLLVLLATQVGHWRAASPWNVVYALVPGARGIRAVPRVGLVVLGGLGRGPGARGGCPGPVSCTRRRGPRGPLPPRAGSGVRPLRARARPGAGRPHRPGGPCRLHGLRLHAAAGRLASLARADRRAVGRGRGPGAHPERVLGELAAGLGAAGLLRPGARGPGTAGRGGGGMGPEVGTPWAGVQDPSSP